MIQTKNLKLTAAAILKWSQRLTLVSIAAYMLASCSKDDHKVTIPTGPYSNGFFILNEGWFGHEAGSVNFYSYGADTIQKNAFAKENDGNGPATKSATLEDGVIIQDQLFLISKAGGAITVADAATLKQKGQITLEGADFRSMAALDANTAVVSSGGSIYTVDLNALTISTAPVFKGNNIKKLYASGNYLIASNDNGADIITISDWKSVKHFDGPTEGYVKTPDGQVYGAGDDLLVTIDAAKQDTSNIALKQPIWKNAFTYNAPSLISSSRQNAVFYIATPTSGYSGTSIYRYVKGDASSLSTPFITLPAGETFYSTGLAYDKKNDQIVTFSITGYTESDKNFLRFYNASTGALVRSIEYGHIYFPANIVFYN